MVETRPDAGRSQRGLFGSPHGEDEAGWAWPGVQASVFANRFRFPRQIHFRTGTANQAVLPTTQGFAVVELLSVEPGEIAVDAPPFMRQQYERLVANLHASQEAYALMRQLRVAAEVDIFEGRLQ